MSKPVTQGEDAERLFMLAEVAAFFRVDPKTVARWVRTKKITCVRTLGGPKRMGNPRFRESDIAPWLNGYPLLPAPRWLTGRELAARYRVHPKTVSRWGEKGLVPGAIRTPGGTWRFPDTYDPQLVETASRER